MSTRESFNPETYELDKSFRLTRFTELKGTGCKVPQDVLQKLLESLQENHFQEDEQFLGAVMPRLAAGLMHTFNAHAATDITGFGILGHAQNLAKQQRNEVSFVIHNLPVLAKMAAVSKACGNMFGLMHGTCPETSGGLLICLPREQAARFCAEIKSPKYGEGHQAWIIGIVEKGNRTARIIDKPRIIEVAPQVATQNVNPTPGATS